MKRLALLSNWQRNALLKVAAVAGAVVFGIIAGMMGMPSSMIGIGGVLVAVGIYSYFGQISN